jgi:hypothetical protein
MILEVKIQFLNMDRFLGFGYTNYDKNSKTISVILSYVLEMIIPLKIGEREKTNLH